MNGSVESTVDDNRSVAARLGSVIDHIEAARALLASVQRETEDGACWVSLENARRALHGAAIAASECAPQVRAGTDGSGSGG